MADVAWVDPLLKSPETVPHTVGTPAAPVDPQATSTPANGQSAPAAPAPADPAKAAAPPPPVAEKKPDAAEEAKAAAKLREARRAEQGALNKLKEAKNIQARLRQQFAEAQELKRRLAEAKANPEAHLRQLYGENWYEELTQYRLQGGTPPVAMAMQAVEQKIDGKLQEISRQVNETRSEIKAREDAEAERIERDFGNRAVEFVKSNAEKYEFTNLYGQADQVPALIRLEWQKAVAKYDEAVANGETPEEPQLMSYAEAADLVEKHFEDLVAKSAAAKKWQARQAAQAAAPATPRTLSNDLTASTPSLPTVRLTEQQRIENALAVAARLKR